MKHTPGPVETLARYCIQISSDHYQENPDFRDAVDAVLGQPIYDAAPDLLEALKKAEGDINWMLNNRKFLNPHVFDYIETATAKAKP